MKQDSNNFLSKKLSLVKRNIRFYQKIGLSRLFISGGMPRSGSTLLFNIIRILLEEKYNGKVGSGWLGQLDKIPDSGVYLVKGHTLDPLKMKRASLIFYSYRDLRDALVSRKKKFGREPSLKVVQNWIQQFRLAQKYSNLMLKYELMMADPSVTINQVAKLLEMEVDTDRIQAQLPSTTSRSENTEFDPVTLLHKDHVTGTKALDWKSEIPSNLVEDIYKEFKWWFIENDYEI